MSSIGGINSSMMNAIFAKGAGSRPDPAQKFKELDTDGNGSLDKTELSAMAKELSSMTGKTVDLVGSMQTYDTNNDGQLSQDETNAMMKQVLGPPPDMKGSDFNTQQAMQSYQANSGADDRLSALLKILSESTRSASSTTSTSTTGSTSGEDTFTTLMKLLSEDTASTAGTVSPPDPDKKFKEFDTDGNGSLNKAELDVMAKDFSKMSGQTIDTEKAISTYDSNGDGELSKSEMDAMMKDLREQSGGPQAGGANARQANTEDKISLLKQLLEQYTSNIATGNSTNLNS